MGPAPSGVEGFDGLTANQGVTFTYDAAGNRTQEQAPAYTNKFSTNNLNQLTNITPNPIPVKGFADTNAGVTVNGKAVTLDAANRFATTIPPTLGTSTPLTVLSVAKNGNNAAKLNHVLNTQPYTYDANGNLIKDDQKTYSWDGANRLIQVSYINAQPATIADTVQFTYDGLGRRVSIVESRGTSVLSAKTFVWCGAQVCQERDATGKTITKRFFALGEQINGTNYYYAKDHLGSVREMTDAGGTIQAQYDYDAWGRQTKLAGSLDSDFGYTGFYVEKAACLDLTLFRAYDSEKGRWISRDPLAENSGVNLYEYVRNNSCALFDPLGLIQLSYEVGGHIGLDGWALGGSIKSISRDPWHPFDSLQPDGTDIEAEVGVLGDIGVNFGVSDLSGTCGKDAGFSINVGSKYFGVSFTLNKDFLDNFLNGSTHFTDYIDGISVGVGIADGAPLTGTFTLAHTDF